MNTETISTTTEKYKAIVAWCGMTGSYDDYQKFMIQQAHNDNAPELAIYKQQDGSWATLDNVDNENTKDYFCLNHPELADAAGFFKVSRTLVEFAEAAELIDVSDHPSGYASTTEDGTMVYSPSTSENMIKVYSVEAMERLASSMPLRVQSQLVEFEHKGDAGVPNGCYTLILTDQSPFGDSDELTRSMVCLALASMAAKDFKKDKSGRLVQKSVVVHGRAKCTKMNTDSEVLCVSMTPSFGIVAHAYFERMGEILTMPISDFSFYDELTEESTN